jgi:DNA polymerase-3 subunit epsilon
MLPSFLEFVGASVLVGHNLRFDLSFLDHALVATGRDPLANPTVDTLALARRLVREEVPNCTLGTLAAVPRLDHQPSHRALTDVLATGDLLHAMVERAGSYGIEGLAEFLTLPRLIGHPQGDKLRLTRRLPRRPGVYWFTDGSGQVLYVGKATDLHHQVRSHFSETSAGGAGAGAEWAAETLSAAAARAAGAQRRRTGRLLRQLHAVHHRELPDPPSAAAEEGRLIEKWDPPFNRPLTRPGRPSAKVGTP